MKDLYYITMLSTTMVRILTCGELNGLIITIKYEHMLYYTNKNLNLLAFHKTSSILFCVLYSGMCL